MATVGDRSPPSTAAVAIATAIVAALGGYFLGQASSLGIFRPRRDALSAEESSDGEEEAKEEENGDALELSDFAEDAVAAREECKLVLVVRTDLGMTKGKIAAQCSHATLACYKAIEKAQPSLLRRWERLGQAKIAVQARSEEELELLQAQAMSMGLCAQVIHDAGRTQIAAGSATVLGVGPGPKSKVDVVTGQLKLL